MKIESETFSSRPNRELNAAEEGIFTFLEEKKIPFLGASHDHADTMEDCIAIEDVIGASICKNLFLCNRQETEYYLLLMPRKKPFKTKYLSAQLGCSRLSFASADAMWKYLHTVPGSVSFLELLYDTEKKIQLVVDKDLQSDMRICAHPGLSVSTLCIAQEDFLTYVEATGHRPVYVTLPQEIVDM